jgi:hypothetical protein
MIKKCLFAIALLSLALAVGCAKGGNGIPPVMPSVAVSIVGPILNTQIYPTQTVTLTAATTDPQYAPVTWSSTGSGWTMISSTPATATTSATATYQAPATVGSQATVTATLVSDASITGPLTLTVADIFTEVTPSTLSVGTGLTQQFTAVALPTDAPQTFTWTCTAGGNPCASFVQNPNIPGAYLYTAHDSCSGSCIQVTAASPLDPLACVNNANSCTIAKFPLVASRVSGTYAFQFSGYDASNHAVSVAGTFTASATGAITSGVEDELTSTGPVVQKPITGGSYTPTSSDVHNSNNAGTLTLSTGNFPDEFQVVLDGAGDLAMIESDGHGVGSGIAQKSASSNIFSGDQTYAFGFSGVDSSGNRVGYVGVLPMNGSGAIASGQMDTNDNGSPTSICGAGPCGVAGTYTASPTYPGLWHMTISAGSATPMDFDFFISSGATTKTNPLTFYAISTDAVTSHPVVSGTMVLQDSTQTYNNADFNGISVSALTGIGSNAANANVSLTLGSTDGSGDFAGQFDQNNAGTILSSVPFPGAKQSPSPYTYAASGSNGRYTFNLLGNPGATPVAAPLPFVLYASGQNRGFLLDQSSASVMTGTMNPQGKGSGIFGDAELPGTFAAATTSSGNSTVIPIAANLLMVDPGNGAANVVSGTQYHPGAQTVTGTYTFGTNIKGIGVGTVTLTAPSAENYVIYVLGTSGCTNATPQCTIESFLMIDEDASNLNPSILFAQQ